MPVIIRTSKCNMEDCNTNKRLQLKKFLEEYEKALKIYVSYLYNNDVVYKKKDGLVTFSLEKELLEAPSVFDYKVIQFPTELSARALSSAMTQACGIIKGIAMKRKKLKDKIAYLNKQGYSTKFTEDILLRDMNSKEPVLKNVKAELSSKCANFIEKNNSFDGWLKLSSLGNFESIWIPVSFSKHVRNLKSKGFERMNSFLLSENFLEIRWKKIVEKRTTGITVGCDTGILDLVTFSEDTIIQPDSGYSEILKKLSRKRRNSQNYKDTLIQRDNYIRYILNKCNFSGVKQLNIENNSTLKYKKRTNKFLSSHAYGILKTKLERISEEHGVHVHFTLPTYRSQRCSACGWTQKSNRQGKLFLCKNCHFSDDSDKNSSKNQLAILPYISSYIREKKENILGFFWNPGCILFSERSLESLPQDIKDKSF